MRQKEGLSYKKAEKKYIEGFKLTEEESIKQRCCEIVNRLKNKSKTNKSSVEAETKESNRLDDSFSEIDIRPTSCDESVREIENTGTLNAQIEGKSCKDKETNDIN